MIVQKAGRRVMCIAPEGTQRGFWRDKKQLALLSGWHLQSVPKYRFSVLRLYSLYAIAFTKSQLKKKKSFQVSVLTLKAEGWRACPSRSMWIFSIVCGLGMLGKGGVTGTVFFLVLSTGDS